MPKIIKPKRDKSYVSPADRFHVEFDRTHSPSASQQAEIKKHQQIAKLRDKPSKQGKA